MLISYIGLLLQLFPLNKKSMKKQVFLFALTALLLCACENDDLSPASGPDYTGIPVTKSMLTVGVTGKDNKLTVSCNGRNVTPQDVSVWGLTPSFYGRKDFPPNSKSVTIGVPGYGTYSIQVQYKDLYTNTTETWDAVFYYLSEKPEENKTDLNATVKCQHDFSGITREMWWTRDGNRITFEILVWMGNYKAVLYPTYTSDGQSERYIQTRQLNAQSSPQTLVFEDAPVAYELRIYSTDCRLPYEKCTNYLFFDLMKMTSTGLEPGYLN